VLVQDVIDIDIPPELPNSDAQRTELQLRYATLQQDYHSFSLQHETLVSKTDTLHKKIDNLKNKNAEMKDLLEEYIVKQQQQLNDAFCRVIKEHDGCEKVKEQLQDLAY
jgi:CHASE3 domain sensor protein